MRKVLTVNNLQYAFSVIEDDNDIFESEGQASAPYSAAIKVAVRGVGPVVQHRNASGEQRESMTVGCTDHSMGVKGTL